MIELKVNDTTYTSKGIISVIIKRIFSLFSFVKILRKCATACCTILVMMTCFIVGWWISVYTYESKIIHECETEEVYPLLHSNYVIDNCTIQKKTER